MASLREALGLHVAQGDVARQPTGAVDFQVVAEHQHADAFTADRVVAVRHGVDDGLTHHGQRILGRLLTCKAFDAHPAAHVGGDERLGLADLVRQGAAGVVAEELVAHGRARNSAPG